MGQEMVSNDSYKSCSKQQIEEIRRNRIELKNMWCTEGGINQFINMADACCMFEKFGATDVEVIGARNLFVDICTALGLFDEEFIRRTLRQLKEYPDIPITGNNVRDDD